MSSLQSLAPLYSALSMSALLETDVPLNERIDHDYLERIVDRINSERVKTGLPPLKLPDRAPVPTVENCERVLAERLRHGGSRSKMFANWLLEGLRRDASSAAKKSDGADGPSDGDVPDPKRRKTTA